MPSPDQTVRAARALADGLRQILGPDQVLTTPSEVAAGRRRTWLPPRARLPLPYPVGAPSAIVRPRNVDDVVEVLRRASEAGVPVVAYGGGTGVMGGAASFTGSLLLDVGAMRRIVDVDPGDLLACVEPGVVLGDLARAAEAAGLLFAHDPWSQPIATVGGAVATNGVGYLAAGYGAMGDQVRGLEAVLANGEIVAWNGAAKAPGPALWRLFVGAEGTLGVVTRVIVQLFPRPAERRFAALRFPTFADGFRAITRIRASGLHPSMVDYEEIGPPPLAAPADLYLAFDGPAAVVRPALTLARTICRESAGVDRGRRAAEKFWEHRHDTAYQFLRWTSSPEPAADGPAVVYANVAVPPTRVLDYCARVVEIGHAHGLAVRSFGIWARPELVSFTLEGQRGATRSDALDQAMDAALLLARREGGSIEYVHGAGLRLAHLMREELGSASGLLDQLKACLDPRCTLNPGKLGLRTPASPARFLPKE